MSFLYHAFSGLPDTGLSILIAHLQVQPQVMSLSHFESTQTSHVSLPGTQEAAVSLTAHNWTWQWHLLWPIIHCWTKALAGENTIGLPFPLPVTSNSLGPESRYQKRGRELLDRHKSLQNTRGQCTRPWKFLKIDQPLPLQRATGIYMDCVVQSLSLFETRQAVYFPNTGAYNPLTPETWAAEHSWGRCSRWNVSLTPV